MSAISNTQLGPQTADSLQILTQKLLAANAGALGAGGSARYEDAGVAHPINAFCIVPIVDTVFTALVGTAAGETGVTQPAGIPLFGVFTNVTLTSGKIRVYSFL